MQCTVIGLTETGHHFEDEHDQEKETKDCTRHNFSGILLDLLNEEEIVRGYTNIRRCRKLETSSV